MHPVIRIVSLIVLGLGLSFHSLIGLMFAAVVVLGLYIFSQVRHFHSAYRLLRRMRWLLLSILIVYFWFTPGQPVTAATLPDAWLRWIPTVEGIVQGVARLSALVILVFAANLLLQTTKREQLVSALLWIMQPLKCFGSTHQRFAVRVALVLEKVGRSQDLITQVKADAPVVHRNPVLRIAETFVTAYQQAIERAEQAPCEAIEVPEPSAPPGYQWLIPTSLIAVFWLAV